jgi:hypothetical protein
MAFNILRRLLPDYPVRTRIWRGPFRGARVMMSLRDSQRKAFGLYEHENNAWLELALPRVSRVLDVGANDGYFTFGCAAGFQRLGVKAEIICFEPEARYVKVLRESVVAQGLSDVRFKIVDNLVGSAVGDGMTTLDAVPATDRCNTLIKIDVEGAEVDVVEGAQSWMDTSNLFVIEVHKEEYLRRLQRMFAKRGLRLIQVNQRALPILGRERREESNCWLVSDLTGPVEMAQ